MSHFAFVQHKGKTMPNINKENREEINIIENFKIVKRMLNFAPAKQSDGLSPLLLAREESPGSTEHSTS